MNAQMDKPLQPDLGSSGSETLLAEILSVLQRIDGHIQVQQGRLNELEARIATGTMASTNDHRSLEDPNPHRLRLATKLTPLGERRTSTFPTSPSTRLRDLGQETGSRTGSAQSAHSTFSSLDHFGENKRYRQALTGQYKEREPLRRMLSRNAKNSVASIGASNRVPDVDSSRRGTVTSLSPPPMAQAYHGDPDKPKDDLGWYTNYPPPESWVATRTHGRRLEVRFAGEKAQKLWSTKVKDSWTIPPDGRVEMTFQQHILERLNEEKVISLLDTLQEVSDQLEYRRPGDSGKEEFPIKRGNFKVTDYEFDPNYEVSVAEYRADDIPIGRFREGPIKQGASTRIIEEAKTAPWKRIIEIRGLSKSLIDEHEIWTTDEFRNPFNEPLPVVNRICPLITNRSDESSYTQNKYTGMKTVYEALKHHRECWPDAPPCDDDLCFHITFYEIVDLTHDNELEGEIWRSGKVHSDNPDEVEALFGVRTRRIRESACTIVVVPDTEALQYWTMLYMCPNGFEVHDKSHEFEHYDTISSAIKGRDAAAALEVMMEFSVRIIVRRWEKIIKYFTWLLGHRDTLLDPDTHDSLLFDDDSFSRSRKYFWAINYLAEMEISINGNIVQLEKFARGNKALDEQLTQLLILRERIRGQRDEAIALRDGLFNASAVMESRASTRLSENIKLLTFVSIFFLPLSFCMSVWSVSNTIFSLKALVIVAILVGLSTYLLVFNLNNVVKFCGRVYNTRKLKLIDKMSKDPDSRWKEQGQKFTVFQPKENRKPSEWVFGVFLLHILFGNFHLPKLFPRGKKDKSSYPSPAKVSFAFQADDAAQPKSHAEAQTEKVVEGRKKSSIKDTFARLSLVFRRGAFASQATPSQHQEAPV